MNWRRGKHESKISPPVFKIWGFAAGSHHAPMRQLSQRSWPGALTSWDQSILGSCTYSASQLLVTKATEFPLVKPGFGFSGAWTRKYPELVSKAFPSRNYQISSPKIFHCFEHSWAGEVSSAQFPCKGLSKLIFLYTTWWLREHFNTFKFNFCWLLDSGVKLYKF